MDVLTNFDVDCRYSDNPRDFCSRIKRPEARLDNQRFIKILVPLRDWKKGSGNRV